MKQKLFSLKMRKILNRWLERQLGVELYKNKRIIVDLIKELKKYQLLIL